MIVFMHCTRPLERLAKIARELDYFLPRTLQKQRPGAVFAGIYPRHASRMILLLFENMLSLGELLARMTI